MAQTIEEREENIKGIKANLQALRDQESLFIKKQTLEESAAKVQVGVEELREEISRINPEISSLVKVITEGMDSMTREISTKISGLLPEGEAVFEFDPDSQELDMGWKKLKGEDLTPYPGLSGGQKITFDAALARALMAGQNGVVVIEAAEVDDKRLQVLLKNIESLPADEGLQFIVNTCHPPPFIGDLKEWNVVEVE